MSTASFRDPSGRVFFHDEHVYRAVNSAGVADLTRAANTESVRSFVRNGDLTGAAVLSEKEAAVLLTDVSDDLGLQRDECARLLDHEIIPFQSFPYEWSSEMLYAAAELTLDLQEKLLGEGMGLKDATPYNILFRGPKPVFVDWLSFETRDPLDHVWSAQAQFLRTFILPLLVNKYFGLPISQIFLNSRDGIEPEAVYAMCSTTQKIRPPFLTAVTLPTLLGRQAKNTGLYETHSSSTPEKARFILDHQIRSLRKQLRKVRPDAKRTSGWAEYMGPHQHFTDTYLETKRRFVSRVFEECRPGTVLDVGCNTGYFSRLAAEAGASVVSIDLDEVAVSKVWRMAAKDHLNILPLVLDISRPTPATGWRNTECDSFVTRIKGKMDAVVMLAVIHHMLVTDRIPLAEILELFQETTRDSLIVEFIPPQDPMFKQIARGRDHLYSHLTEEYFEETCKKFFQIERSEKLADSDRRLYFLRK